MGAWTTLLLKNSNQLKLELTEKSPMLGNIRGSLFAANATLDLSDLGLKTLEGGGQSEFTHLTVELHSKKGGGGVAQKVEATMEAAAHAAEQIDDAVDKHMPTREESSTLYEEFAAAAAEEGRAPEKTGNAPEHDAGLFSSGTIELRASVRLTPLDRWSKDTGAFVLDNGALEQPVTPLPAELHSYAHGGFMGLACSVLGDPVWRTILKEESPPAWAAMQREHARLKLQRKAEHPTAAQGKYMIVLENSPVMCAYGLVRNGSTQQRESLPEHNVPLTEQHIVAALTEAELAQRGENNPLLNAPRPQLMDGEQPPSPTNTSTSSSSAGPLSVLLDPEALQKQAAVVSRYQAAMAAPNQYGYMPLAMEWDIWVSPRDPQNFLDATINHGSAAALVTQAVLTAVPGMKSCARKAGSNQIIDEGLSPVEWLTQLGHSINRGVHGDKNTPLPLISPEDTCWRLHVEVDKVSGVDPNKWTTVRVFGDIDSDDVVLPDQKTDSVPVNDQGIAKWPATHEEAEDAALHSEGSAHPHLGAAKQEAKVALAKLKPLPKRKMAFWPLPKFLCHDDFLVLVRGNPAGVIRNRGLGFARISLEKLVEEHPEVFNGEEVLVEVEVEPWVDRPRLRVNVVRKPEEGSELEDENISASADGDKSVELTTISETPAAPEVPTVGVQSEYQGAKTRVTLKLKFESVGVITAMEKLGVPRPAAQTAVAMLTQPGGLYLDVKSAYSTAYDLQVFASALRGYGITCRAVCSFKPEQLLVGAIAETVLFFHGLSGLENACDVGRVSPGQMVLFNGASFLEDTRPAEFECMSATAVEKLLGEAKAWPIDDMALRKYLALCEQYGIVGGFYVQEPDTAPAGIDALCRMVAEHGDSFPLGFAYGHLSGRSVAFLDAGGRGFASQQLVEEFAARKDLAGKTIRRIRARDHRHANLTLQMVWAARLLHGEDMISISEQQALCTLLIEMQPLNESAVGVLVEEVGGIQRLAARFHQQYELTTPLTLLEAGVNYNYTKSLLRILRNRGVLAGLSLAEKIELAKFFIGPAMRGYGATYLAQATGLRRGLHKHAKENLLCLLESCTEAEVAAVTAAVGGKKALRSRLRGWFRWSWHYNTRVSDIKALHAKDPNKLAYTEPTLKYAALPQPVPPSEAPLKFKQVIHTRDKTKRENVWRCTRKSLCCGFTTGYTLLLEIVTLGVFLPCCVLPRCCGNTLKGACGMPAVVAFILGFLIAIAILVVLIVIFGPRRGDDEDAVTLASAPVGAPTGAPLKLKLM